jgi:hypothetical protein
MLGNFQELLPSLAWIGGHWCSSEPAGGGWNANLH